MPLTGAPHRNDDTGTSAMGVLTASVVAASFDRCKPAPQNCIRAHLRGLPDFFGPFVCFVADKEAQPSCRCLTEGRHAAEKPGTAVDTRSLHAGISTGGPRFFALLGTLTPRNSSACPSRLVKTRLRSTTLLARLARNQIGARRELSEKFKRLSLHTGLE